MAGARELYPIKYQNVMRGILCIPGNRHYGLFRRHPLYKTNIKRSPQSTDSDKEGLIFAWS